MATASQRGVISNWYVLMEGFSTSALDFYTSVEGALASRAIPDLQTSRVQWRESGVFSAKREYLRASRGRYAFDICAAPFGNGYFFSWWFAKIGPRFGLLITLAILLGAAGIVGMFQLVGLAIFRDSCAGILLQFMLFPIGFPLLLVGLGYLVHAGVIGDEEWLLSLPLLGTLYAWAFNPLTYYRLDTALMFQEAVRAATNEVIDGLRTSQGLRVLTTAEREPRLRDLAR